jgi:bifunctional NMN adenylyltransferase/nudix hydrolase
MPKRGVLVARFQAGEVTTEIRKMIGHVLQKCTTLCIVLGEHKTGPTKNNPFDIHLRKDMIQKEFPSLRIMTIADHPSDEVWSSQLDKMVSDNFAEEDVVMFGSEDRFLPHYKGRFATEPTGRCVNPVSPPEPDLRPTGSLRDFREGIIYALHRTFAKVYPTVDMALFRKGRSEILLGMKGIDKKWRLPGGFTDPDDLSYEEAVIRELEEECSLKKVRALQYESSFLVDDWRYRYEEDKIMTILFSADHAEGEAKAGDDIEDVKWFPLADVMALMQDGLTAAEHQPLLNFLLKKYGLK